jgi:hypothetical protein
MNEDFLQFLWQYRLFDENNLFTNDGNKIEIINVGIKNSDAGPDFFNARIRINNIEWAGNIEIHNNASDWNIHKHNSNEAYDNVILHIVWNNDVQVFNSKKQPVLTITLPVLKETLNEYKALYNNHKNIACIDKLSTIDYPINTYLETLSISRLEKKVHKFNFELKEAQYNWEETFYRILAYSFGLKANAEPFLMLAYNTPLNVIKRVSDNLNSIEAIIFGQSGLLPEKSTEPYVKNLINEYKFLQNKFNLTPLKDSAWKFSKIHPPSFPTLRLAQWAQFLYKNSNNLMLILNKLPLKKLIKTFSVTASDYWKNHYHFEKTMSKISRNKIGKSFIYIILINSVLPFMFFYSKEKMNNELHDWILSIFEQIPPENNNITRQWLEANIKATNALQSQALIHLYEHFCKPRFCLRCNIGTYLLLHTKSM